MIYGILSVLIFVSILIYLEYRVCKLEQNVKQLKVINDLLIYDFLKRNKKNIKEIKIDKDVTDELFK